MPTLCPHKCWHLASWLHGTNSNSCVSATQNYALDIAFLKFALHHSDATQPSSGPICLVSRRASCQCAVPMIYKDFGSQKDEHSMVVQG